MKPDDKLIEHLSTLARLEFNDNAKEQIKHDLSNMLGFVEKLNDVNMDGVEPLIYISDVKNVLRKDVAVKTISHGEAMSNVPLKNSDYIKVPKVLKK